MNELNSDMNLNEEIVKLKAENDSLKEENRNLLTIRDQMLSEIQKFRKLLSNLEEIKTISLSVIQKCKCDEKVDKNLKTKLNILNSIYDKLRSDSDLTDCLIETNPDLNINVDTTCAEPNHMIDDNKLLDNNSINDLLSDYMITNFKSGLNSRKKVLRKRGRKPKIVSNEENSESKAMKKRKRCEWPGCFAQFRDRIDLENHMWRHTGEKLYACDWPGCGKHFASKCIMNKHVLTTHRDPQRFKCEFNSCEAAFLNSDLLEQHFQDCHEGLKPYTCRWPGCRKQCSSKLNLQKHNYSHKETKKFKCVWNDCNESYVKRNQLVAHECRVHTGVKPFKCHWPGCEYEACYEQTMRNHQLRHTDDKPYACQWPKCSWAFRRNDHLKVHMLKHTGEKPFSCDWPGCDRRFQTRQTLKTHTERTHSLVNNSSDK